MGSQEPVSRARRVFWTWPRRPMPSRELHHDQPPIKRWGLSPSVGAGGLVTCSWPEGRGGTVPCDLRRKGSEAGHPPGELWATRSEV